MLQRGSSAYGIVEIIIISALTGQIKGYAFSALNFVITTYWI